MELNPYAAPLSAPGEPPPLSDIEQIRKDHISHEASVKSLGGLYLLAAIGLAMGVALGGGLTLFSSEGTLDVTLLAILLCSAVFCILCFWLSHGLHRLRPSAKKVATVFAALGLLIFPVGTIINAYVLYLLLSTKGSMVFSERYQEIIVVTPHIRYKTSPAIYVLLGLLALGIAVVMGAAMFG